VTLTVTNRTCRWYRYQHWHNTTIDTDITLVMTLQWQWLMQWYIHTVTLTHDTESLTQKE